MDFAGSFSEPCFDERLCYILFGFQRFIVICSLFSLSLSDFLWWYFEFHFSVLSRSRNGLEKRISSHGNESRFADPEEDFTATSESCSWAADDKVCSSDNQNSSAVKGAELLKRWLGFPLWAISVHVYIAAGRISLLGNLMLDLEVSTVIMVFLCYGFDVGRSMIMLLKLIENLSISLWIK